MKRLILVALAVFLASGLFAVFGGKPKESADAREIKRIVYEDTAVYNSLARQTGDKLQEVKRIDIAFSNSTRAMAHVLYTDGHTFDFYFVKKDGAWQIDIFGGGKPTATPASGPALTPTPRPTEKPSPFPTVTPAPAVTPALASPAPLPDDQKLALQAAEEFYRVFFGLDYGRMINLIVPEKQGFVAKFEARVKADGVTQIRVKFFKAAIYEPKTLPGAIWVFIESGHTIVDKTGENYYDGSTYLVVEKRDGSWLVSGIYPYPDDPNFMD